MRLTYIVGRVAVCKHALSMPWLQLLCVVAGDQPHIDSQPQQLRTLEDGALLACLTSHEPTRRELPQAWRHGASAVTVETYGLVQMNMSVRLTREVMTCRSCKVAALSER